MSINNSRDSSGGDRPYKRCLNCVHGYSEDDADCAACLGSCEMYLHYTRESRPWSDLYGSGYDDGEEAWS